jgi:hypothetical protein
VIERLVVAEAPFASVTLKVTVEVPAALGVPVIAPVDALSESPAGSVPEVIDQL